MAGAAAGAAVRAVGAVQGGHVHRHRHRGHGRAQDQGIESGDTTPCRMTGVTLHVSGDLTRPVILHGVVSPEKGGQVHRHRYRGPRRTQDQGARHHQWGCSLNPGPATLIQPYTLSHPQPKPQGYME